MDRARTGYGGLLACLFASTAVAGSDFASPDDAALWVRSLDDATLLARSLEAMANRGEISDTDLGHLTEEVFERWPEARSTPPPPVICQNRALHAARAFARAHGVPVLAFPPPFTDYLESPRLPIRVHHDNEEEMARRVLTAAEDAWYHQVEEVGYPAPFTDGDEGPIIPGLWIYISDAGGAAGYAEPLAEIGFTEICDCSVRVVMDVANSLSDVPAIVAHEFNHATQLATDCWEVRSAFENFATAVMVHADRGSELVVPRIAEFQSYPDWPVDYWTSDLGPPSPAYQYGASLFPLYLDAAFGRNRLITSKPSTSREAMGERPRWKRAFMLLRFFPLASSWADGLVRRLRRWWERRACRVRRRAAVGDAARDGGDSGSSGDAVAGGSWDGERGARVSSVGAE